MRSPFCPVETRISEASPALPWGKNVEAQAAEQLRTSRPNLNFPSHLVASNQRFPPKERVEYGDAELACQMIVAGAGNGY